MFFFRRASERGQTQLPWLTSYHSFSFAHYYDPNYLGFSALRVINEDKVLPNTGFDTHSHSNMEIISLVLSGQIAHKDSQGNELILNSNEIQLMSAGSGIHHSEFNPSSLKPLHFLQIWIEPDKHNTEPLYQQTTIGNQEGITELASAKGENSSLKIQQNAKILQLRLSANKSLIFTPQIGTKCYIHLIEGTLTIEGKRLNPADAVAISNQQEVVLNNFGATQAHALIFDLP